MGEGQDGEAARGSSCSCCLPPCTPHLSLTDRMTTHPLDPRCFPKPLTSTDACLVGELFPGPAYTAWSFLWERPEGTFPGSLWGMPPGSQFLSQDTAGLSVKPPLLFRLQSEKDHGAKPESRAPGTECRKDTLVPQLPLQSLLCASCSCNGAHCMALSMSQVLLEHPQLS